MTDSKPSTPSWRRPAAPDRHPPGRSVPPALSRPCVRRPASTVRRHPAARDPESII